MKVHQITYQTTSLLNAPKIHTDIIWDLTILFASIAIVYFASIFFFRNKISRKSQKASDLRGQLSAMIGKFIFHEENASKEEKSHYINLKVQIRDMLRDDFTRTVVSKILLDLRKDVSGSAQDRLFELFQDLDLHKESYKKLKSWRWERVSKGIQELTQMEVGDSYQLITKFINDRRGIIRKQAEIGVVALNSQGIGHFLDTTRYKISEWQQLKLMEVLSNKTDFKPPSFKAWLTSTNKFVVLFALRLIKYYAQNDAKASIIELVKHEDSHIRAGAIDCIREFNIVEALPILKKIFWSCSTDIKIAILDTIGILGTVDDFVFLNSIENKERNYSVTNKALSAINAIKPGSILPTKGIANILDLEIPSDILPDKEETTPVVHQEKKKVVRASDEDMSIKSEVPESMRAIDETVPADLNHNVEEVEASEETFSMDFIPVVVETEEYKEQLTKQKTMETRVDHLDVVFEEVFSKYSPKEITEESININDLEVIESDLDFLPIVVANQEKERATFTALNDIVVDFKIVTSTSHALYERENVDLKELLVHYEEVKGTSTKDQPQLNDIEVVFEKVDSSEIEIDLKEHLNKAFDFEVVFDNGSPPLRIPKVEPSELFNIEVEVEEIDTSFASLAELRVIGEIVTGREQLEEEAEDLPLWLLNEIALENSNGIEDDSLKMEGPEWEAKESQMMDEIRSYFEHIPKPEYYENEVNETTQLLDDIALFGDEREISLLQELMEKESQMANKERIDALMKRFMHNDAYGSTPTGSSPYNVFEELFRNCDTESKLILLDEIVLVGDEKEINFLEQLVSDPNLKISNKAKRSLELLKERSERIQSGEEERDADEFERFLNMMELMPPKESDIFDIDFEISQEDHEGPEIEKANKGKTGGLGSFISDLFHKITNQRF